MKKVKQAKSLKLPSNSWITGLIYLAFSILILWQMPKANAAGSIRCETTNSAHTIEVKGNKLSLRSDGFNPTRGLSSNISARTSSTPTGFTKKAYFNGRLFHLTIQNANQFNEIDDYLSIRTQAGHEITYPVKCSQI